MGIRLLDGKPSIDEIPSPSSPVSILHIRGASDGIVKAEGGQTVRVVAKSANDCIQHFVKANGCDANGRETLDTENHLPNGSALYRAAAALDLNTRREAAGIMVRRGSRRGSTDSPVDTSYRACFAGV